MPKAKGGTATSKGAVVAVSDTTGTPPGTVGESSPGNDGVTTPPTMLVPTGTKAKIEDRLQRVVDEAPPTKNRSPELVPLTAEYEKMRKNLRNLVSMVKTFADITGQMNTARENLINHVGLMSKNSPIEEELSRFDSGPLEALAQASHSADPGFQALEQSQSKPKYASRSLTSVQQIATTQSVSNQREFDQHVVMWAMDWEQVVTERIDRELRAVRKLQGDRDHYEQKVALLRKKSNDLESKGKTSPRGQVAKLGRNEEKLKDAFIRHESEAGRLCALIETVIQDGWIELYQLARNYMKWESNRVGRESDIYSELAGVLDSMKSTYTKNAPKKARTNNVAAGGKTKKGGSGKRTNGSQKKKAATSTSTTSE